MFPLFYEQRLLIAVVSQRSCPGRGSRYAAVGGGWAVTARDRRSSAGYDRRNNTAVLLVGMYPAVPRRAPRPHLARRYFCYVPGRWLYRWRAVGMVLSSSHPSGPGSWSHRGPCGLCRPPCYGFRRHPDGFFVVVCIEKTKKHTKFVFFKSQL